MNAMEFGDALVHLLKSDGIGIPHRPAAIGWKSVAVDIDDVDIDCAQSISLFENACAFVDQGIDAAIGYFLRRYLALRDAGFAGPFFRQCCDVGIRRGLPILVVFVPACAGFLAEATHLT